MARGSGRIKTPLVTKLEADQMAHMNRENMAQHIRKLESRIAELERDNKALKALTGDSGMRDRSSLEGAA